MLSVANLAKWWLMACKGITSLSIYSSEMDSGGRGGKVYVTSAKAPIETKNQESCMQKLVSYASFVQMA